MSWELFTSIVDQLPGLTRAVLHGVGEPMMVKNLPRMILYLKDRRVYVLFNTNGTLLAPKKRQELIDTGRDELRVSLDAADTESFFQVRGKRMFERIVRNVGELTALQREIGAATPRVSLWLSGLKETDPSLPSFVRLAARSCPRSVIAAARVRRLGTRPRAIRIVAVRGDASCGRGGNCRGAGRALPCCIAPFSAAATGHIRLATRPKRRVADQSAAKFLIGGASKIEPEEPAGPRIAPGGPQRLPTRAAPSLMRALRDARGSPPWTSGDDRYSTAGVGLDWTLIPGRASALIDSR